MNDGTNDKAAHGHRDGDLSCGSFLFSFSFKAWFVALAVTQMSVAALLVEVGGLLNFCEATPAQEHFVGEKFV